MGMFEEEVRACDLSDSELREVVQAIIDKFGLSIFRNATPDYTIIEVRDEH